jgi:hypothetical protein
MKREKKLTKRERKAEKGPGPSGQKETGHIHCVACGRHINPSEFNAPATAARVAVPVVRRMPRAHAGAARRARSHRPAREDGGGLALEGREASIPLP